MRGWVHALRLAVPLKKLGIKCAPTSSEQLALGDDVRVEFGSEVDGLDLAAACGASLVKRAVSLVAVGLPRVAACQGFHCNSRGEPFARSSPGGPRWQRQVKWQVSTSPRS